MVVNPLETLITGLELNPADFLVYLLFFQSSRTDTCPINVSNSSRGRDYNISFYNWVGLRADVNKLNHFKTPFY